MLHHGDAKGKGLAGAGGGLGDHVLPLHKVGDGPRLDGSGLNVALLLNGPHQLGGEAQLGVLHRVVYRLSVDFHRLVVPSLQSLWMRSKASQLNDVLNASPGAAPNQGTALCRPVIFHVTLYRVFPVCPSLCPKRRRFYPASRAGGEARSCPTPHGAKNRPRSCRIAGGRPGRGWITRGSRRRATGSSSRSGRSGSAAVAAGYPAGAGC